ncbi:transposase domain-containing protein, partial [Sphingobium sp.]|uniref:transposase domain-containing protein n=1 Tax=Sphingobium sp. TaxID=1912891 RepID=UPI002D7F5DB4
PPGHDPLAYSRPSRLCPVHRIKSAPRTWHSPKSKPRSREKARVALKTRTKNPCFPQFEEEQHNESGIALGRKNWLFAGSKAGGDRAAAVYSVIESAKLNGLEPQAYIADVIAKIADEWPAARWDELMPWNWRPDQQPIAAAA